MFWETVVELCKTSGISPNKLCKEIGLSNATATHWKRGTLPNYSTLVRVADYFRVSVDDLIQENETTESSSLFGKRLTILRGNAGLSQQELAEKVGMNVLDISMIEKGRKEPTIKLLCNFADLFGITLDFLIRGNPDEKI